jgi:flagellar FliJ protein
MVYKFRFEALLSYRKHLKEMAEVELSLEQHRLKKNRDLLNGIREDLLETNKDLAIELKSSLPSQLIRNYSEYISAQELRITLQELEILKSTEKVDEKREALLEKTKQFKIIEKLKEKDIKKWKHQQLLMEQQEISETAIIRYGKEFL